MPKDRMKPFSNSNFPLVGAILTVVVILVTIGLGFLTWNLIEGSEKRVEAIKSVKVVSMGDKSRAESTAAERDDLDRQVLIDYNKNPNAKILSYKGLALTDRGMKCIKRFSNLEDLQLDGCQISDEGLVGLSDLPITHLSLADTDITDKGLETIAKMKKLQRLDLPGTKITSDGLFLLKNPLLTSLDLAETQIDGKALLALSQMPLLTELRLGFTNIKEEDFAPLLKLKNLMILDLRGLHVTALGAKVLARLPALDILDVRLSQLPDDGLKELCSSHSLRKLNAAGTNISDKALLLLKHTKIRNIRVDDCQMITDAGINHARAAMPAVEIGRDKNWREMTKEPDSAIEKLLHKK